MAKVTVGRKACAINPLKSSTPLGAALAYLGFEGAVPLFHGSQGCTSFALVLAVRHFKESIPLQTTAMDEAATVLGGADNMQEALLNVYRRMKPKLIGVASTALVETRGEDFEGELALIRKRNPELGEVAIAFASTPDFEGALEEGWAKATAAVLKTLVEPSPRARLAQRINLLPGVHQTPADLEALRRLIGMFGLQVTVAPDIGQSLDGHVPSEYVATSLGGTPAAAVAAMGQAAHTIAIGEHMAGPAALLHDRTGVPFTVLNSITGLAPCDALCELLMRLSGRPAPEALVRERRRLVDAMLDSHFWFSGRKLAIAADPDLLTMLVRLTMTLGAEVPVAIASTKGAGALSTLPCPEVLVGDLADLEDGAAQTEADLLITHSHGRMAEARLGIPLFRMGFPSFDRLGVQDRCSAGYAGTRQLIYSLANMLMARSETQHEAHGHHVQQHQAGTAAQLRGYITTEEALAGAFPAAKAAEEASHAGT